jgi:hypothetical protein
MARENQSSRTPRAHLEAAADKLLKEGKQKAYELYEDGLDKAGEIEERIKKHADRLVEKIQEKPLTCMLIAGGVGYLLAKIMKK